MKSLSELVLELTALEPAVEADGAPEALQVEALDVRLPLEATLFAGGELAVSAPQGRMRTGFDRPHGQLALRLVVEEG